MRYNMPLPDLTEAGQALYELRSAATTPGTHMPTHGFEAALRALGLPMEASHVTHYGNEQDFYDAELADVAIIRDADHEQWQAYCTDDGNWFAVRPANEDEVLARQNTGLPNGPSADEDDGADLCRPIGPVALEGLPLPWTVWTFETLRSIAAPIHMTRPDDTSMSFCGQDPPTLVLERDLDRPVCQRCYRAVLKWRRTQAMDALWGAREDIQARRREFVELGAHEQYLNALDDALGLVTNQWRALGGGQIEEGLS